MSFLRNKQGADTVEWAGVLALSLAVILIAIHQIVGATTANLNDTGTFIDSIAVPTAMP